MSNIPVNPTTSYTVAADDNGAGVMIQYVKLDAGAPGATLPVNATAPLPVTGSVAIPAVSGTVSVSNTVNVQGSVTVVAMPAISMSSLPNVTTQPGAGGTGQPIWLAQAQSISVTVVAHPAISGTVSVSNTINVLGSVTVVAAPAVSGTVSVSNTLNVLGSITVVAAPAVSGTVSISNTINVLGSVTIVAHPAVSISSLPAVTTQGGAGATGMQVWLAQGQTMNLTVTSTVTITGTDWARTQVVIVVPSTQVGVSGTTALFTVYQGAAQTVAGVGVWVIPGGKTFLVRSVQMVGQNSITTTPVALRGFVLQSAATPTWTSATPIAAAVMAVVPNATAPQAVQIQGLSQDIAAGVTVGVAFTALSSTGNVQQMVISGYLFP